MNLTPELLSRVAEQRTLPFSDLESLRIEAARVVAPSLLNGVRLPEGSSTGGLIELLEYSGSEIGTMPIHNLPGFDTNKLLNYRVGDVVLVEYIGGLTLQPPLAHIKLIVAGRIHTIVPNTKHDLDEGKQGYKLSLNQGVVVCSNQIYFDTGSLLDVTKARSRMPVYLSTPVGIPLGAIGGIVKWGEPYDPEELDGIEKYVYANLQAIMPENSGLVMLGYNVDLAKI